jgi:hypothetical protein
MPDRKKDFDERLRDYKEVSERLIEFGEKYPQGYLTSEIVVLPPAFAERFIAVRAYAYRTGDDSHPATALAWEPVPGSTPYTKNSELMNAETSAWGRAIVALRAADARRIASAEEVRNRQAETDAEKEAGRDSSARSRSPGAAGGAKAASGQATAATSPPPSGSAPPDVPSDGERAEEPIGQATRAVKPGDPPTKEQWEAARAAFGSTPKVLRAFSVWKKVGPRKSVSTRDITSADLEKLTALGPTGVEGYDAA